jgi:hypothetical protein
MYQEVWDHDLDKIRGKQIASISISDDTACVFKFTDGSAATISDEGQSCCESRWMTCDDDLEVHKDAILKGIEILESDDEPVDDNSECTEIVFLRIDTSAGSFRLCMHNSHNGYYGGFSPSIDIQ